jgi:hypothetical protein
MSRANEILEYGQPEELSNLELAREVGDALQKAYPDHPWIVGFQGASIVVRHMAIADCVHQLTGKEGFAAALPHSALRTPGEVRRSATMMGGQLLEAFGLPRGKWDGRDPVSPQWDRSTPFKRKGFT